MILYVETDIISILIILIFSLTICTIPSKYDCEGTTRERTIAEHSKIPLLGIGIHLLLPIFLVLCVSDPGFACDFSYVITPSATGRISSA